MKGQKPFPPEKWPKPKKEAGFEVFLCHHFSGAFAVKLGGVYPDSPSNGEPPSPFPNSNHPGLDKRVSLCYDESIHDVQGTLVQNQGLELAEAVIKSSHCHGKPTIFGWKYNQNIFGTVFPRHSQQKPNRKHKPIIPGSPSCPFSFFGWPYLSFKTGFLQRLQRKGNRLRWVPKRGAKALTRQALYHCHMRSRIPISTPLDGRETGTAPDVMSCWNHLPRIWTSLRLESSLSLSLLLVATSWEPKSIQSICPPQLFVKKNLVSISNPKNTTWPMGLSPKSSQLPLFISSRASPTLLDGSVLVPRSKGNGFKLKCRVNPVGYPRSLT